ncbi:hypothetical protein GT037_004467 [Alternaria burnsii]|uniref:Uncharacterized protein n=1 Tax=Alternaria burnsii TaxID=1187904 RepID=A0A8H7B515_9PLEO|nr:uncharacterized protein GT037_004467 [Alternaria burnsii]KAF7677608.1 hypothetical protein GT037_004467 [Alternaria burnsii]
MKPASTPNQISRAFSKPRVDAPVDELGRLCILFGLPLLTGAWVGSETRQVGTKPAESDKKRHVPALVLFVATSSHLFDSRSHASESQLLTESGDSTK